MLTEELMRKVRELEIATRRSVSEVFAGEYSSAFRGRGMEFSEVREYQPGDDIRTIDWNVTARQGSPFVKRYVEERELTVLLVVDLSASGGFGSTQRVKNETAAELCGVVALAATKNNDKVGLLLFTDRVEMYVPPAKGTKHVLRIIRELLDFEPGKDRRGTDMAGALEHLGRVQKRRAVVFLVSDFLVPDLLSDAARAAGGETAGERTDGEPSAVERGLRTLCRRHDVIAARIDDPRERAWPSGAGLLEFQDAETGRRVLVDASSARARRAFEGRTAARRQRVKDTLNRCGVDQIEVTTGTAYIHTLIELFRRREKRR